MIQNVAVGVNRAVRAAHAGADASLLAVARTLGAVLGESALISMT